MGELAHNTAHELKVTRDEVDQLLSLLAGVQRAWRPAMRPRGRKSYCNGDCKSPGPTPQSPLSRTPSKSRRAQSPHPQQSPWMQQQPSQSPKQPAQPPKLPQVLQQEQEREQEDQEEEDEEEQEPVSENEQQPP